MIKEKKNKDKIRGSSSDLKQRTFSAGFGVMIILLVLVTATFAWYIYNTKSKTTNVHMAAGTSTDLLISKTYDGEYSTAVSLDTFFGTLNPVSTDKITNGFQAAIGYEESTEAPGKLLASIFGKAATSDYFKTSLFVKTNAESSGIYACKVTYSDETTAKLLATGMRIGYVIHKPGKDNEAIQAEHIFVISEEENPHREYNTKQGKEGDVLDSTKTDGSVVTSPAHGLDGFVEYDSSTGVVTRGKKAVKLFDLKGGEGLTIGEPVQIDVYLWLEGCDPDCTANLANYTLQDVAIAFAAD